MVKSHESKVKAIKDVEEKKNAEIKSLKREIEELKSGSSIVAVTKPAEESAEEMQTKLVAYQNFITQYIVKAQEEKYKAIKAAEETISKKYEAKLNGFMLEAADSSSLALSDKSFESDLYKKRNAKVATSAEAGKSRWDAKELQRVSSAPKVMKETQKKASTKKPLAPSAVAESIDVDVNDASGIVDVPTPPEVIAADHGLRADGGVGGLTLAERVAQGADASATYSVVSNEGTEASSDIKPLPVVDARNAMITAAAKAGKQSRWGAKEEMKAINNTKLLKS